jgi:hypothetical protein
MFLSSTFVCDAIVPANGSAKPTIPPDLPAVAAESKSKYFFPPPGPPITKPLLI